METTLLHGFTNCIMLSMVPDKYVKSFQKAAINSVQDRARIFVVQCHCSQWSNLVRKNYTTVLTSSAVQ